ncbi:MAG: type IV pilin [Methanobacteriota archaeon]|nr:MAG: type IV pilin [Euryarchaeota archaeon]
MRNHKKSVSPVIAVVLLIALTVAAGAIIWTIVLPLLEPTETLTLTNKISSDWDSTSKVFTFKGTFDASSAGTINSVVLDVNGGSSITAETNSSSSVVAGANTLTFYFTVTSGAGSGSITITWTPDGGSSTTYTFDVTWS